MITWGELSGISGELVLDSEEAVRQLKWMFEPGDLVHLVNLRPKTTAKKTTVISMGASLEDMVEGLGDVLDKVCVYPWSTYVQISPSTEIVTDKGARPDAEKCAGTRVLFCDADTGKDGAFKDKAEVQYFIDGLSVSPGLVVWTGSEGGAHLYWRVDSSDFDEIREEIKGKKIGERWWTWLTAECGRLGLDHVRIDRLVDLDTRVLRLAGTIRYPKHEGDVTAPVIAEYKDAPVVTGELFRELTDGSHEEYARDLAERRRMYAARQDEIVEITGRRGMWSDLIILSMVDELADRYLDWSDILEEYGWTYFREGGDGAEEWTRPGGSGKSATVNWPESPESPMSLFSDDPSTGLADLKEMEVPLTKWTVFLRLVHGDDVWAALDDLGIRGGGNVD